MRCGSAERDESMAYSAQRAELNLSALEKISDYLTRHSRFITEQDVREITAVGVSEAEAMLLLLCAATGVEEERSAMERELARGYFALGLKRLDAAQLADNPYMRMIRFPEAKLGRWQMTRLRYAPYELFVRDDLMILPDGREIPQLGYFAEAFAYPAVLQDGREWMTVTPNEIATMEAAIAAAHGHVCAMGLGLGYFAFMVSEKETVSRVTVVERDEQAICLFEAHILPQFPHKEKIRIVHADAFDYVKTSMAGEDADFAFVDLWHDVADGAQLYMKMKLLEPFAPGTQFSYWIETSITSFLRGIARE